MTQHMSPQGIAFNNGWEGCPLTAYKDIVGVVTIGPGLTNRSSVVTRELGKLVAGKTKITQAVADRVSAMVFAETIEPAVNSKLPGATQFEFDASGSGSYNLGTGMLSWTWARMWRKGKKTAAWDYYSKHYNTAGGKKVSGLVRRRQAEANLALTGDYGNGIGEGTQRKETTQAGTPDPTVKEVQEMLTARGFNPGAIDGWMGAKTKSAVMAYQRAHPDLIADGIIGPATIAQLRRDAQMTHQTITRAVGSTAVTSAASAFGGFPWQWVAVIAGITIVLAVAYVLWHYRETISRRINTIRGKTVET